MDIYDKIGGYNTYLLFGSIGFIGYALIPFYVSYVVNTQIYLPLVLFYSSTLLLFSFFGGGFSTMPNYETSIFGNKYVGPIHGKMMSVCALSGIFGPFIVTYLRKLKYESSIYELTKYIDKDIFLKEFNASMDDLNSLIQSKTVTIQKLMELIPNNLINDNIIIDQTPFLYNNTMYAIIGAIAICALSNLMVKKLGLPKQRFINKQ